MNSRYIACDLGGTNINIGLLESSNSEQFHLIDSVKHKTKNYATIEDALSHMLRQLNKKYHLSTIPPVCICANGPTDGEFCNPSNLSDGFIIRRKKIENMLKTQVKLINDFSAIGYSLAAIDTEKQAMHFSGSPLLIPKQITQPHVVYLIIGAGTGLGTAQAHEYRRKNERIFFVQPGEGGWADMTITADSISPSLYNYFSKDGTNAVCWEDVISSEKGILSLYKFLCEKNTSEEFIKAQKEIEVHSTGTGNIRESISVLSYEGNSVAQSVLNLWVYFYGRCCSNYAVMTLPHALFLAGGATEKNKEKFIEYASASSSRGRFLDSFQKGYNEKFHEILCNIPVYAFTDYNISLYGSAWYIAHSL